MDKETGIFNGGKLKHSLIHAQKIEGERHKGTIEMGPFFLVPQHCRYFFIIHI